MENIFDLNELPLVLSIADLCKILKIGRNAAYKLASSGEIRVRRVGKSIRIPRSALLEYLEPVFTAKHAALAVLFPPCVVDFP